MAKNNETVFYMSGNKMKSGIIKGISTHEGTVWSGSTKMEIPNGEKKVIYTIENYDTVESVNAFATADDLIRSLFSNLETPKSK